MQIDPHSLQSTTIEKHTEKQWIWENNRMIKKEITFIPLFYRIFDQLLVNTANKKQRYPNMNHIKVTIDIDNNLISVWNNSVDSHPWAKGEVESALESFWDSSESRYFLKNITIETADVEHHKLVFTRDGYTLTKLECKSTEHWSMVSFTPDLGIFGMEHLEDDTVSLMERRVVDLAGCLGKAGVKVELDGACVLPTTFEDYVNLYLGADTMRIYEKVNDRLEVCVGISDGHFEQVSFVNYIATLKGGPHVDYITGQIITYLAKVVRLQPNYIKSNLWVFVNAFDDPAFDSLITKENLTTDEGHFRSTCKLTPQFLDKIEDSDAVSRLLSYADSKNNRLPENTHGKRNWKINNPALEDAYFAATDYSEDCTLILTLGDSAEAFARCGLSIAGQVYYGMLSCELPNVKSTGLKKLREKDCRNIKKILGLEDGKDYENVKELRYGHLMIMTDQDPDGSRYKGLLINFLYSFWPSLLKVPNFLLDFVTPIVKASNKETKDVLPFYTMPEYEAWKENLGNEATKYEIKYRKWLGASETEEVAEYFADLDNYTKNFVWEDDEDGYAIERAFSEKKISERKDFVRAHQAVAVADIDSKEKSIRYRDFINKGLILFSRADNHISIPSVVDGLKPVQRKILFCAFKKPIIEEIGVLQFSGYVYEHSGYRHCEESLIHNIIGMTEKYVGSNNINLLQPIGLYATHWMACKDLVSGKNRFTQLSPIARYIFHEADELLLNYLNDNGKSIEPAWFIPIIPMVLVNGSEGTGTEWSSFVPNYNPRVIIANLKHLLNGEPMVPMHPWYKCFKGTIVKTGDTLYTTRGTVEEIESENALNITEFPIKGWTKEYEEFLKAARKGGQDKTPFIEDYETNYDDNTIEIMMTEHQMDTARQEGFEEKLKLTTELSTSNMHLIDAKGVLKKYDTPQQILMEYYDIRLQIYRERKKAQLRKLKIAALLLDNKVRYIRQIRDRKISLEEREKTYAELKKQGFKEETEIERKPDELYELKKKGFKEETEVEEEVAAGEEKTQGNASKTVPGTEYDYLLLMGPWSTTDKKMQELQKEMAAKEKAIDVLTNTSFKSLWLEDLNALDHQLQLDGNYPSADDDESSPEIAEEAPEKKSPTKRAATSPLPERVNEKRLKR